MTDHHHPGQGEPQPVSPGLLDTEDEASRSLADALRVSFRLLSLVMVLVVAAWALTGLASIDSGENGIIYRFGRIVRTDTEGLAYAWPFPIGRIEKVNMRERRLVLEEFWMHLTGEQQAQSLDEVTPASDGLRPGWDGALLTGDRSLLHMKLEVRYAVANPVAYKRNVPDPYTHQQPGVEGGVVVRPTEEVIRSAVSAAAIRSAATRTADGLKRGQQERFKADLKERAQQRLDALNTGLVLKTVNIAGNEWPLRARSAYQDAQDAISEKEQLINTAQSEAESTLASAAGANYRRLVGEPWRFEPGERQDPAYDLIGQYSRLVTESRRAERAGETARSDELLTRAEDVLAEIDQVLVLNTTGGEASRILAEAKAYKARVVQSVKSRARQFAELRPEFERRPNVMMQYLWAETRKDILARPGAEKYVNLVGEGRTVLRVSRPPEITKELQREALQAVEEEAERD